jgi:hypothetical protein
LEEREDLRRDFVSAIVNDPQIAVNELSHLRSADPLILEYDLEWALNQILRSNPVRRAAWSTVISFLSRPEVACKCWDLLLQRIEEIPELAAQFSWLRAYDLDEPVARQAKAEWLRYRELEMQSKIRTGRSNIEQLLEKDFAELAAGKSFWWIELCNHLASGRDGFYPHHLHHDLTEYPGWQNANGDRRNVIRTAAKAFLLNHGDGYAEIGNRTNFSDPGYVAIWLLRDEIRSDRALREAVAIKWIDAMIGKFDGSSEYYKETAALAYELNPDATLRGFIRELKEQDEKHGQILGLSGFRKCWDSRFTAGALDLIRGGKLKAGSIESIFRFIAPIAPADAAACARPLLDSVSLANTTLEGRTVHVLTACFGGMPAATWHFVWPIIEADARLAKKVFWRIADGMHNERQNCLPTLTERQLADLYLKVRGLFPPETDPDFTRGGRVGPRGMITQFRGEVVGALEARGTEDACRELLRLANTLPTESLWLRWRHYSARTGKRRKSWTPIKPSIVLQFVSREEARLVANADDLIDVLLESLERFQIQLTGSTLPRSDVFWHWDGADTRRHNFRPRDEAFLSDEIARWLREDLAKRGIVIDREVQPRRGQHTDIQVTAAPRASSPSTQNVTVVIEVKGCWNADVQTAIDRQLVDKYLRPNGLAHGIYLVGWFVCSKWENATNSLKSDTFGDAQKEVDLLAAAYDGKTNPERVRTIVLDCRYP